MAEAKKMALEKVFSSRTPIRNNTTDFLIVIWQQYLVMVVLA